VSVTFGTEGVPSPICNLCGGRTFGDVGRRIGVRCATCLSLERTRTMGLLLDRLALVDDTTTVLHIAPERGLAAWIRTRTPHARLVDQDPDVVGAVAGVERLDLCRDLPGIEPDSFDLVVHSHVLEHVTCNYTAVLAQLHRVLRPTGTMVCCIPFLPGRYEEDLDPEIGGDERNRRFGQHDHVRRFGTDDVQSTLGMAVRLEPSCDVRRWLDEDTLRRHAVPETCWTGYTPHTVLVLRDADLLV
jgi:phosphoglycolate phosphatase